ncbi:MAG: creatininase family protein, partial [Pseudonocardia sp.]|nr:creatininase family protein [Pseudonocardia sp.]
VAWFGCAVPPSRVTGPVDAHAGRTETAILLALDPSVVRADALEPGNPAPLAELLPTLLRGGVAAVSPNGVLGDPRGATAEEGEELLTIMVGQLRERLARWQPDDRGRLS